MEVFIHEALHAAYWDIDEDAINEAGRDIARMLHRLGYRRSATPKRLHKGIGKS
jgi:hypothetical protein